MVTKLHGYKPNLPRASTVFWILRTCNLRLWLQKGGKNMDTQKEKKLKPCPRCLSERLWTIRVHPARGIFTKYYIECVMCHWCGVTKIGKKRAARAWNELEGWKF